MRAGHSAADCLRHPLSETLPEDCKQLKYTFGACKRGLIDMRKRFRGPVPVSYKGGNPEDNHMLYSGLGKKDTSVVSPSRSGPSAEDLAAVEAMGKGELVGRDGGGTGDMVEDIGRGMGWREKEAARRREG
jgi:hypothetical protein